MALHTYQSSLSWTEKKFFWPSSLHRDCQILPFHSGWSVLQPGTSECSARASKEQDAVLQKDYRHLSSQTDVFIPPCIHLVACLHFETLTDLCHRFFCLRLFGSSLLGPTSNSSCKITCRQITTGNILHRFRSSDQRDPCRNLRYCVLYTKGIYRA